MTENRPYLQFLQKNKACLFRFAADLVRIESIYGNETLVAKRIQQELTKYGIRSKLFGSDRQRKNLVADLGRGSRSMLLNGHLDTVSFGDLSIWKDPPLSGIIRAGRLYGRGSYDMKSAVAAAAYAAIALKETQCKLAGKLRLLFNADEESLELSGIKESVRCGYIADAAVIGEPSLGEIRIGGRGCYRFELIVKGKSGHTAGASNGINATTKMAKALLALERLKLSHKKHRLFSKPNLTPGTLISGGSGINVFPAECRASVDVRLSYGMTKTSAKRQIVACLQELKLSDRSFSYRIDDLCSIGPYLTDQGAPIVSHMVQAVEDVMGYKPKLTVMNGGSDANHLSLYGVDCAVFGILGDKIHAENEFATTRSILDVAKTYAYVSEQYLAG